MGTGLWVPVVASFLTFFAGPPALHPALCRASRPATRRPLFQKGAIRKLFLWTGDIFLTERQRIRDAGTVDFREPIYGHRSLSPLWVFCAFVHGGRHPPKAFGFSADASHLHDLKRPSLFRRDKVPARNTHKIVRLRLYAPKKVFEGSKGRFFKNAPLAGSGTASRKKKKRRSWHRLSVCRLRFGDIYRKQKLSIRDDEQPGYSHLG